MSKKYEESENLAIDAKVHLSSEYGQYRMKILDEMIAGAISKAAASNEPNITLRHMARYGALNEIKESIISDLGE